MHKNRIHGRLSGQADKARWCYAHFAPRRSVAPNAPLLVAHRSQQHAAHSQPSSLCLSSILRHAGRCLRGFLVKAGQPGDPAKIPARRSALTGCDSMLAAHLRSLLRPAPFMIYCNHSLDIPRQLALGPHK